MNGTANEKQKTTVRIAGKDYTLISSESSEYMHRVARYVDRRLNETALLSRQPMANASILTCISMCDELMKAQDDNSRLRRELDALHRELDEMKKGSPA